MIRFQITPIPLTFGASSEAVAIAAFLVSKRKCSRSFAKQPNLALPIVFYEPTMLVGARSCIDRICARVPINHPPATFGRTLRD